MITAPGSSSLLVPDVAPSGDSSGATDLANINTALLTSTRVYLVGNYTVNGTITIPSGVTLILADAQITLAAGTNVPIVANPSYGLSTTPAASGIQIRGIGRAILNYNGTNQTEQTNNLYNSCSICLVNVSQFLIQDVQFTNAQYVHIMMQACNDGRVQRVHLEKAGTDKGFIHADIGCSNLTIDGVTVGGTMTDAVFSMLSGANAASFATTPYGNTLVGAARNISDISWRNIVIASSTGMFNIYIDNQATVSDIDIENIHNTYTGTTGGQEIGLGPGGYNSQPLPAHGSISGIRVTGYTFGGQNHWFLTLDNDCLDFTATNIRANGTVKGLLGNLATPGSGFQAGYYPQVARIRFNDVNLPTLNSVAALSNLVAGYQVNGLEFNDVTIGTANGPLLKNSSDIVGLRAKFKVGTMNANPFQSTGQEIGEVSFMYDQEGLGMTAIFPQAVSFRIVQPFPAINSADATPLPQPRSELICYPGKDPTGGSNAFGGRYTADGKVWNLAVNLGTRQDPEQIYQPLLFHYCAADIIGVANGANVTHWPDRALGNFLSAPAAAPTFVASDATLSNQPSVSFAGASSQYLQNTLLNPLLQAQPFTIFIAYYWSTLTSGWVIETAGAGSAADQLRLFKNGTVDAISGPTGFNGVTTLAATTAYVTMFAASSNSGYIADNKINPITNATTGSVGSVSVTGLTLGSGYTPNNFATNVHIAEVIGFVGLLSNANAAIVSASLAARYGVTLA